MKVVIAGQKKFGLQVLQLCEQYGFSIKRVIVPVTDNILWPYAQDAGYSIAPTIEAAIRSESFDLGITAHSFGYIDKELRTRAKIGWLGYHPSLLPRHRGRSSIEWAKRMKDPITGGTLYWLNEKWDEGDIAYQDWMWLDHNKTIRELWDEDLMPIGLNLFYKAFYDLKRGTVYRKPQASLAKFATYEPRLDIVNNS